MSAARAETKGHTDPAGDAYKYDFNSAGDPIAAPEQTDGDITAWAVTYSTGSVTVRAHFTDLAKTSGSDLEIVGNIRTDTGLERQWRIEATDGHWKGRRVIDKKNGTRVHCTSRHSIDYTANTMQIKIARSCFDKPTWIKAQLATGVSPSTDEVFYIDDGLTSGSGLFEKRTGRIHRG